MHNKNSHASGTPGAVGIRRLQENGNNSGVIFCFTSFTKDVVKKGSAYLRLVNGNTSPVFDLDEIEGLSISLARIHLMSLSCLVVVVGRPQAIYAAYNPMQKLINLGADVSVLPTVQIESRLPHPISPRKVKIAKAFGDDPIFREHFKFDNFVDLWFYWHYAYGIDESSNNRKRAALLLKPLLGSYSNSVVPTLITERDLKRCSAARSGSSSLPARRPENGVKQFKGNKNTKTVHHG